MEFKESRCTMGLAEEVALITRVNTDYNDNNV
jgi:hypothetical protein